MSEEKLVPCNIIAINDDATPANRPNSTEKAKKRLPYIKYTAKRGTEKKNAKTGNHCIDTTAMSEATQATGKALA
jgi:hypothetical protein